MEQVVGDGKGPWTGATCSRSQSRDGTCWAQTRSSKSDFQKWKPCVSREVSTRSRRMGKRAGEPGDTTRGTTQWNSRKRDLSEQSRLWDNLKWSKICIIGVFEGKNRKERKIARRQNGWKNRDSDFKISWTQNSKKLKEPKRACVHTQHKNYTTKQSNGTNLIIRKKKLKRSHSQRHVEGQ